MSPPPADRPVWRLIESAADFELAVQEIGKGEGPVALDAERASGFRYSQRAYLVQVYRRGVDAFLIDPQAIDSFEPLQEVIADEEWILHAATQDLPCLRDIGLAPQRLFDTELAARLLGMPRVNLAQVVQEFLEVTLEKAHSAADWSTRPLPSTWLEYAALDVTYLPDLRDALERALAAQEKNEIAQQEFEALTSWEPKPPHPEPWRRLSGLHTITSPRGLAIARELWIARDELAQERDTAPGRLLPDRSIIAAAAEPPRSAGSLAAQKSFSGRASRSELDRWWTAIVRAKETEDLPSRSARSGREIPHHRSWAQRFPDAAARLQAARDVLASRSAELDIPIENLLLPDAVRRLAWEPPEPVTVESIRLALSEQGARPWQVELIAADFVDALQAVATNSDLSAPSQDAAE